MSFMFILNNLSVIKDFVLMIVSVIGAFVALKGLSTWNRQLKGSVEYDLARRLLKSTYKLRDAMRGVRNPFMTNQEMPEPPLEHGEDMKYEQIRHYGIEKAYLARWDKVNDIRTELQADMLEGEAIWGADLYPVFKDLFDLHLELFRNVRNYVEASNPNINSAIREATQIAMRKNRDVLYDMSADEPDEFTKDVTKALGKIEAYLKPHLRK